jgi:hypothetical protein
MARSCAGVMKCFPATSAGVNVPAAMAERREATVRGPSG